MDDHEDHQEDHQEDHYTMNTMRTIGLRRARNTYTAKTPRVTEMHGADGVMVQLSNAGGNRPLPGCHFSLCARVLHEIPLQYGLIDAALSQSQGIHNPVRSANPLRCNVSRQLGHMVVIPARK